MDLKQNAFLRQWISPHRHRKYIHFFTIKAHLEYYFFNYKEIATFSEGKKIEHKDSLNNKVILYHPENSFFNRITVDIPTPSILAIFIN